MAHFCSNPHTRPIAQILASSSGAMVSKFTKEEKTANFKPFYKHDINMLTCNVLLYFIIVYSKKHLIF